LHTPSTGFSRHITRTNNAVLPGGRAALSVDSAVIGWVLPDLAAALAGFPKIRVQPRGLILTDGAALFDISKDLSARGLHRWRGEIFDVRAVPGGAVLARIDRGGLPVFGIAAEGVHVNGLVSRADGLHVWVARRAANKALDPGKLDHIVAGGIPAGFGAMATLVKEAAEEAAIPADLARRAVPVGTIAYAMERPEGLRRDRLYCYDLMLPEGFTPRPNDGEVAGFELWPIARAVAAVRDSDEFKFNVNVVMIDLFLRTGAIAGAEAVALRLEMAEISFPAVPR
jgi:8-oxo-dGTP pyrophosphatase MutT (NUDIX family)